MKNVRIEGKIAEKMNRFFQFRIFSEFAKTEIFGEARYPIEMRNDDDGLEVGGFWRGEFWGKLMLSASRVADYSQEPGLMNFIREECHRLMAFQDEDGYLGSYANKDRVGFTPETAKKADEVLGWHSLWNLWNRKYIIWSMLMASKVTGDRDILQSVIHQADQLIDMMHRLGMPLIDTGCDEIIGLPSMSLLKPMLMLYEETGNRVYLDFASEMLPDWDRDDGRAPNFFRNAFNGKELNQWYPQPGRWAKSYEMMSCLDGILEYYRVTGEKRCLDTIAAIYDNFLKSELNPLWDVGFVDKLIGAAHYPNASTELCDVIHWIRLSYDLFLITGEDRYADYMELAFYNAFLAGVYRDGTSAAFAVRASVRHDSNYQCNCAYNHCCVNNAPRTFMDMAEATVTQDKNGTFQVNFYHDATATTDGVTFVIRGNYPVNNTVTVSVSDEKAPVRFRKPMWCPAMKVEKNGPVYTVVFDMAPRIVNRPGAVAADANDTSAWPYNRYLGEPKAPYDPVIAHYRKTMAATMMNGPLVLARACRAGCRECDLYNGESVNNQGCSLALTPISGNPFTWGTWRAEIKKGDQLIQAFRVCDFQSAADSELGSSSGNTFNIWV